MNAQKLLPKALPIAVVVLAIISVLLFVYSSNIPEPSYQCWDGSSVTDPSLCPLNPWSIEGVASTVNNIYDSIAISVCKPHQVFGLVIDLC